jgi:hypothetical protein
LSSFLQFLTQTFTEIFLDISDQTNIIIVYNMLNLRM